MAPGEGGNLWRPCSGDCAQGEQRPLMGTDDMVKRAGERPPAERAWYWCRGVRVPGLDVRSSSMELKLLRRPKFMAIDRASCLLPRRVVVPATTSYER